MTVIPKIIEIAVHEFHELSDKAKEKARAWFREGVGDWDWYEFIYEQIAAAYCRTIAGLA